MPTVTPLGLRIEGRFVVSEPRSAHRRGNKDGQSCLTTRLISCNISLSMMQVTPLKRVLQSEGRRQTWLASQIGMDPPTLSRIVTGRLVPTDAERLAIAKALGREVEELWPDSKAAA